MAFRSLWIPLAGGRGARHCAVVVPQHGTEPDRFERLFGDIDAAFAADEAAARHEEVVERTRYERGRLTLADRLRAAQGQPARWWVRDVGLREAAPVDLGVDWVLAEEREGRGLLVPLSALEWVAGLPRNAIPAAPDAMHRARDLRMVLGRLGRDRITLRLHVGAGQPHRGVVGYAGADFVELDAYSHGGRTGTGAAGNVTVPLGAVRLVELPPGWRLLLESGL